MPKFKSLSDLFSVLQEKSLLAQRINSMVSNNKILSIFLDSEMLTYWTTQQDVDLPEMNFTEKERLSLAKEMVEFLKEDKLSSNIYFTKSFEEGVLDIILQDDYMSIAVHKVTDESTHEQLVGNTNSEHSIYF